MKKTLLEEVLSIKNLFETKSGFLISEQVSPEKLIGDALAKATSSRNNEETAQNILSIKDRAQFYNINSYLQKLGREGDIVKRLNTAISDDATMNKIVSHLQKIGLTVSTEKNSNGKYKYGSLKFAGQTNTRQENINGIFCSVDEKGIIQANANSKGQPWEQYSKTYKVTPQEEEAARKTCPQSKVLSARQKNINSIFCSVDAKGIIQNPGSVSNGQQWIQYALTYDITAREQDTALKSCPQKQDVANKAKSAITNSGGKGVANVGQRFSKSATSLGIQNATLEPASLQKVLDALNGTPQQPATGGTVPSIQDLNNIVAQLTKP